MYTYKAIVLRIIDGDTIDVDVDLGFFLRQRMRLRLNGIDTPEIRGEERPEGLIAKAFVEDAIAGETVVVRTYKLGKYGRYVADVYYLYQETSEQAILTNGKSLVQELLKAGLATEVEY